MNIVIEFITKNLNLNVARSSNILFNNNSVILESFKGLSFAGFQSLRKIFSSFNNSHPFTTSSRDSLDENRVLDFISLFPQILRVLIILMVAWNNRYIG